MFLFLSCALPYILLQGDTLYMIKLPSDFHAESQPWLVYHVYLLRVDL